MKRSDRGAEAGRAPAAALGRAAQRHNEAGRGLGPRGRGLFGRLLGGLRASAPPRHEGRTIAVASGKGGTGKSFLATSLAVLTHRSGKRTSIVDCDFGLACDHLLLGVKPTITLQQLVQGQATLDQALCTSPCGPRLLPGASGVRRMANMSDKELSAFARELGELAGREEALFLDLGAGIAPATILSMLCADSIVLVTQPEIAALVDAYAVVKCIGQIDPDAHFLVVVNRVPEPGRGKLAFEKLTEVARQHAGVQLDYLGEIVEDPSVTQHRLGQLPLVATDPEAPLSRSLFELQQRLAEFCGGFVQQRVEADEGVEARFKEHRLFL